VTFFFMFFAFLLGSFFFFFFCGGGVLVREIEHCFALGLGEGGCTMRINAS